jgi:Uma2 family endonuclease
MNAVLTEAMLPARLRLDRPMTDEELFAFCARNRTLRIERDSNGELILMSPSGLEGDNYTLELGTELTNWSRTDGRGKTFGSNAGFTLPDGSMRSPDAAWMSLSRWNALPDRERKRFGHVVPEFVIEVRSESDGLKETQEKMRMWLANGIELGWLIDPKLQVVEVYRPGESPEVHESPISMQGTGSVRGFCLIMERVWG